MTVNQINIVSVERKASENNYAKAHDLFRSKPTLMRMAATAPGEPAPDPNSQMATSDGAVQFHLIGQKPTDPAYSNMMNDNQSNLLAMGGLVFNYMKNNYPTVDSKTLDMQNWVNVVSKIPDLAVGSRVSKTYSNRVFGASVSGTFLSMIAKAIITDGASLLTDFQSYLTSVGDVVFSASKTQESYNVLTCTYQSYLVDNGAGGWFDYGAIVLRQIKFKEYFLELKSSCSSTSYIDIDMEYDEVVNLIQTSRIRQGGTDYELFKELVNANSTEQFSQAKNFFNGGSTPQKDITPKVN